MGFARSRDEDKAYKSRTLLTGNQFREMSAPAPAGKPAIQLNALMMEAFVDRYLKHKFDGPVETPDLHREMWADCCGDDKYVAWAAPRGHAKSTSITHAFTLAVTLFRQRDFVLLLSDTWSQAVEFLRDLKTELMTNEDLIRDFGIKRLSKDTEDDMIVVMRDNATFRIVARGAEQKVRGLKWNNKRPNLILFDDIEGDEQVESKPRRDKFFKWLMKAVLPCGSDDCIFRMVGTVMHSDSALQRILKDPTWKTKRYKAHKSWSDFSEILWPEKFDEQRLRDLREKFLSQGESDGYSQEYLNEPIAAGNAFFRPEHLLPMREKDFTERGAFYVGWDFAVSKTQRSDFTVGVVWKVDPDGLKHIVDCRRGRWDSKEIIDVMMAVEEEFNPRLHFTEKGTIDNALGPFLDDEMRRRNRYLSIQKITPTKDKETRAKVLQGMLKSMHVRFDKKMTYWPEMEDELCKFPKGEHDDIVDALNIVGLGLRDVIEAPSREDFEEEVFFNKLGPQSTAGRNATTGY